MSNTKFLFAHARSNENEATTGGYDGDQTGYELNAIKWYDNGWDIVYRPTDTTKAELIADFMEKAVANGFIGYSQGVAERRSLFDLCVENDFHPELITTPCSCDCSSLVYTAFFYAYKIMYGNNEIPTVNAFETIIDAEIGSFEKFTDSEHLTKSDNLKRGDIIIARDTHIGIWI